MFHYYYTIFIDKFHDKIVKQIQTLVSDEIIPQYGKVAAYATTVFPMKMTNQCEP